MTNENLPYHLSKWAVSISQGQQPRSGQRTSRSGYSPVQDRKTPCGDPVSKGSEVMSKCEACAKVADVYAMGKYAGDWGGRYCLDHIPTGFIITDRYDTEKDKK